LAENSEIRSKFSTHILDKHLKEHEQVSLSSISFYPIKELLIEILSVAHEHHDYRSAFRIIMGTQGLRLQSSDGSEATHMFEYYYTQPIIRCQAFWQAAIHDYSQVRMYDIDLRP
jgi:hypothetical protein